jgi:hypothetical protein
LARVRAIYGERTTNDVVSVTQMQSNGERDGKMLMKQLNPVMMFSR